MKFLVRTLSIIGLIIIIFFGSKITNSKHLPEFEIVIKNHFFTPAHLVIPANTKIKLIVK